MGMQIQVIAPSKARARREDARWLRRMRLGAALYIAACFALLLVGAS